MTNGDGISNYNQDFTIELGIRINDLEERTNNIKEKINLVSKNFILVKEDFDERIGRIEKENSEIKKELSFLKKNLIGLMQETERWVRRDEIILIERMLKDFQPLEFIRKKDLEELLLKNKEIVLEKNKKPKKLIKI